ncbi:hypothetical protein CY34DRAFT_807981 [Suillus luteus UH-Slu-Lm8-n1]|uniref:Uncharacterized protein n=1 Tax=Suillus luteus UH-Slu-Lm8-n1 TaxID=930992 RepID=A0A0C9ZPS8_9AGAM|nr:hypothetical protein CY34DRAFT_807981 [Suillus luteus UH-Slu-Lm8-n1]
MFVFASQFNCRVDKASVSTTGIMCIFCLMDYFRGGEKVRRQIPFLHLLAYLEPDTAKSLACWQAIRHAIDAW